MRKEMDTDSLIDALVLSAVVLTVSLIALFLASQTEFSALQALIGWLDPVFFIYNILLAMMAILIVPFVTFFYVHNMREEKRQRLLNELTHDERNEFIERIDLALKERIKFRNYLGSMIVIMIVIALGAAIILFFKPTYDPIGEKDGVNFAKGANFLLLGPFIELYIADEKKVYHHIIVSLTAFQFGFLGAYVYFISYLVRNYFTLDLTPNTYVDSTIRMVTGSILSLVVSFILPIRPLFDNVSSDEFFLRSLPVAAFFIGFFPSRGLLLVEKFGSWILNLTRSGYNAASLSELGGVSYAHEVRLRREGFDNLENLSHAEPLDLALRTGFSFRQLKHWIGEAWLRVHLGEGYPKFEENTGITSREELTVYLAAADAAAAASDLASRLEPPLSNRVLGVCALLKQGGS